MPLGLFILVAATGLVPAAGGAMRPRFAAALGQEDYAESSWEVGLPPMVYFETWAWPRTPRAWMAACVELRRLRIADFGLRLAVQAARRYSSRAAPDGEAERAPQAMKRTFTIVPRSLKGVEFLSRRRPP